MLVMTRIRKSSLDNMRGKRIMRTGRYRNSSSNNRKFSNSKQHLSLAIMTKNLAFKGHQEVLIEKEGKGLIQAQEKGGREAVK
jgi:hypothetical protein